MKNRIFFYGVMVWAWAVVAGMFPGGLRAQSCYVQLDDASGFNTASYLPGLEEAAQKIWDVFWFDTAYRDSFKVFSFGFYKDLKTYDAYTYPDAFEDVRKNLADKQSPYCLLIGRQTDHTGVYTGFFVAAKLPDGGQFPCLTPEKTELATAFAKVAINQQYNEAGRSPLRYAEAEKAGIETFGLRVDKLVNCCSGNKTYGLCEDEMSPATAAETLSDLAGFVEHKHGVIVTPATFSSPVLESDYSITITNDNNQSLDLTQGLQDVLVSTGSLDSATVTCFDLDSVAHIELYHTYASAMKVKYGGSPSGSYKEDIVLIKDGDKYRLLYRFDMPHTALDFKEGDDGEKVLAPALAVWLLKRAFGAGIGVGLHIGVTVATEKWFNEDCETWRDAWNSVELKGWDLLKAAAEGALGIESVAASAGFGAVTSAVGYLLSAGNVTLDGFFESVFKGALEGYLIGLGSNLAGKLLGIMFKAVQKITPKISLTEYSELFATFAFSGKLMKGGHVRAWKGFHGSSDDGIKALINDINSLQKFSDLVSQNNLGLNADGLADVLNAAAKKGKKWDEPGKILDAVKRASDANVPGLKVKHLSFGTPSEGADPFVLRNAKQYQKEASGDAGLSFEVGGRSFDDVALDGKLIDRKYGHGSSVFNPNGTVKNQTRANKIIQQATAQVAAASGKPIRWEISTELGADGIRQLFDINNISIEVIHVAQQTIIN